MTGFYWEADDFDKPIYSVKDFLHGEADTSKDEKSDQSSKWIPKPGDPVWVMRVIKPSYGGTIRSECEGVFLAICPITQNYICALEDLLSYKALAPFSDYTELVTTLPIHVTKRRKSYYLNTQDGKIIDFLTTATY